MLIIFGFIGYQLWHIKVTEDVSSVLPQDERINSINHILNNSKMADQLVFHFQLTDSSLVEPDSLIEFARPIMETVAADTVLVKDVSFEIAEEQYASLYDYFYQNLPYYLDSADYAVIEKQLETENVNETLRKNFMSLVSPAGMATKNYIFKDPLSIVPRIIKRLEKFKMDANFELYNAHVFTVDHKHLLAFVNPVNPSSKTRDNQALIARIDSIIGATPNSGRYIVEYYGGTAVAVANAERIKTDIFVTVLLAVVILLAFFVLVFRSPRVVFILFFPVVVGTILSLAILLLMEGTVSAISLGIGAVLIGINIDYGVHFFTHFRHHPNVKATLRDVALPVMLGSATTAIAFMCLYVVRSEALNQLGLFAAISVMVTTVFVLIFMPLMLRKEDAYGQDNKVRHTVFDKLASISPEKHSWWVALVAIITLVIMIFPANVGFNSDISTLNYQTPQLKKAEESLKQISSQTLGSVYMMTKGHDFEQALEKMEAQESVLQSLEKKHLIKQRSSATDLVVSKKEQQRRIAQWYAFWDRQDREKVQRLLKEQSQNYHFKENAFNDFYTLIQQPFEGINTSKEKELRNLFLKNYVSVNDSSTTILSMLKIDQEHKAEFYKAFENDKDVMVFDKQYFVNQFFKVLSDDFSWLVNLSMAFVFLVLLASFGRIELTLVTFLPLLISWSWTLWLMKLVGVEFNIFNVVISTFILGLGDDFCIFMLSGLQDKYKFGTGDLQTFRLSALLSSFTVITGIGVLIFAGHPALKSIALVSILGIVAVIIVAFTLVPVFFNFLVLHRGRPRVQPVTMMNLLVSVGTFIIFLFGAMTLTLLIPVLVLLPLPRKTVKYIFHWMIAMVLRFVVWLIFPIKKVEIDKHKLDFSKPSIIIANHQSHLDLAVVLKLHPKMIVLTNKWVYNNPFYGFVVRFANYYPVYKGLDHELELLKKKVSEGYSILVFPEGTRTADGSINRFHQGAFWLAGQLGLDVQPLLIHGANHCMYKNEFFLRSGQVALKVLDRIEVEQGGNEGSYRAIAKSTRKVYQQQYELLARELETPRYFRRQLFSQYLYKGPVLEWYMKVKVRLENDYDFFHRTIPVDAKVTDVGCGYGFLAAILAMTSDKRTVQGVDYDELKISVAAQANLRHANLSFECVDITSQELPQSDVYVINDVLHYLPEALQQKVMEGCMNGVSENGMIIVRDADSELVERTRMTRLTELFSTKLLGFNKTAHQLTYTCSTRINEWAAAKGFSVERIDMAKHTSNITYILRPRRSN
jgi:1-acyl-sn-glycerol-3-phosphate acyltransferase